MLFLRDVEKMEVGEDEEEEEEEEEQNPLLNSLESPDDTTP